MLQNISISNNLLFIKKKLFSALIIRHLYQEPNQHIRMIS